MSREEKKQEQAARVAWMYYVAGMTQQDIARELGISRQVAQRLVSSAREQGMVTVKNRPSGCPLPEAGAAGPGTFRAGNLPRGALGRAGR
ncbi:Transcriptional regulator lsrR [Cedecea neteri]|uniref:Transcriptional regulator lsrR n=1 Tax=Cedecea neteri TaxID=158822 RepID=A0A2X3IV94_9ENTR|nr:Transcriptional regulator lsrR [Cedecea neteri]